MVLSEMNPTVHGTDTSIGQGVPQTTEKRPEFASGRQGAGQIRRAVNDVNVALRCGIFDIPATL